MGEAMTSDPTNFDLIEAQIRDGDKQALALAFELFQPRLAKMVELRMDSRLKGRIDSNDVLQEAFLTLQKKLPRYCESADLPLFLWFRLETLQKLIDMHRFHLGTQMRSAGQEVSLHKGPSPQVSSLSLAEQLLGRLTSASVAAMRSELRLKVQEALNQMEPIDREILALRHFEELTNAEAARVLELSPTAACNRYVRALRRLKDVLEASDDGSECFRTT